jgi:PucR C-terminal helix-turn-helix domain/GGDEF-like domain
MAMLDNALSRVAERFEPRVPGLADRITVRVRKEVEGLRTLNSPELWDAHRRVTVGSRLAQCRHLRRRRALPQACSDADLEAVRLAVHGGIPLGAALHAYRIGHDVSLEAWLDSIESLNLATPEREACIRAIVRFTLEYNDRLTRLLELEYEVERKRVEGRAEQVRLRLMRDLVEGVIDRADDLNYDLGLEHLGIIAWGDTSNRAVQAVARSLDCRSVSAPTPDGLRWAWLGLPSFEPEHRRGLRRFSPPPGSGLAIGKPHSGPEGFARTHRQAGTARLVATRRPQPVTLYEDVALEGLTLGNELWAREFVADVLTGLDGDDTRSQQLRATLHAYFDAEQNASATAAALGVHEATVSRHLHQIEERTGHRVNQRRAELETALRLTRLIK